VTGNPQQAEGLRPDFAAIAATDPDTPVGLTEIRQLLGAARNTVDGWRSRKLLPDPDWPVGGRPAWRWAKVEAWARATGRLP
jgi:hypothetical protein